MNIDELIGVWSGTGEADGLPENRINIAIERTPDPEKVVWTSRLVSMREAPIICHTLCSVSVAMLSIEEHVKVGFVKKEHVMLHTTNVPQFCHQGIQPRPDLERGCEMPCYVLEPSAATRFTDKSDPKHAVVVAAVEKQIRDYFGRDDEVESIPVYHAETGEVLARYSRADFNL